MAIAPDIIDAPEETDDTETVLTMLDVLQAKNLVPLLTQSDVSKIGSNAVAEFETDWESCDDWRQRFDTAMDAAMQKRKAKTFPWANASNVIFPLLTQAAVQFQARAYPAIVDGGQVTKATVLGPDPDGTKRQRADRVAAHMTWQYLNDVPGWEEDTDKLLLQLPIIGCVFRKTWHDPIRKQNNSETVSAKDFVVNYKTTSLDKAPRFTHVQRYYPHEIEAFIRAGEWSRVHYDGDDGSDPHSLVEILEQHRLIDLDDDGLPEPYVVTCTRDGHVARIAPCFDMDGIYVVSDLFDGQKPLAEAQQAAAELATKGVVLPDDYTPDMRVVRIERREYFTKYGFIPAPDGSFYDMGFGTLTEDLGKAVNTIINQLIDAGTLSNMQGGFLGGGVKLRGGNMRFTPGEWKRVEGVTAGPLRDNILPLQLPGPSPVLFQVLGMLIDAVRQITSVSEIMTGNQDSQTAPTTALALIEEGQKVFTAIYQRIHRAFGCDIKIMFALNRDYLDEEQYFALNDDPQVAGRADYQDRDLDVVPVSDPRAINDRVKASKAMILGEHNGDPLVNQVEIRKRKFEAVGIDNIPALMDVPELPPPPEAIKMEADAANAKALADAEVRAKDAATAASLIAAAKGAYELGTQMADPQMQAFALEMLGDAQRLASAVFAGGTDGPTDMQPGSLPGMEGPPVDQGIPPVPDGPGVAVGDELGAALGPLGPPADDGGAGAGGDVGRPVEPVM